MDVIRLPPASTTERIAVLLRHCSTDEAARAELVLLWAPLVREAVDRRAGPAASPDRAEAGLQAGMVALRRAVDELGPVTEGDVGHRVRVLVDVAVVAGLRRDDEAPEPVLAVVPSLFGDEAPTDAVLASVLDVDVAALRPPAGPRTPALAR